MIVLCCGLLLSSITAISNKMPSLLIPTLIAKGILCACLLYIVGISIGLYREIRFPTPVDPKVQDVDRKHSEHNDYVTRKIEEAVKENPALSLWALFFLIVYLLIVRILYNLFKRMNKELNVRTAQPQIPQTEPPPSYVICMDPSALPSYTDAIKKASNDTHLHSHFHNQPVQMTKNEETTTSNAAITPAITQNMHTDSSSSHSNNLTILGEFLCS
ncbi:hypothetical protein WR25_16286 [Diploscapter pachys]|uniref:Uncharacterized protein n=1 Tax=Diploscapter pachys TaxID=2018661 RepID=A0A2A2KIK2_9BILA|nr:hypothetical protein WR25_16286 [Diploscapter pachys]